jgi:hypothetical protein
MLDRLGQLMRLPLVLMGYLFEMAAVTARGLEQLAARGLHDAPQPPPAARGGERAATAPGGG